MRKQAPRQQRRQSRRRPLLTNVPRFDPLEGRICFSTFNVMTTADAGVGSLRQAILDANATAGADRIEFHIGAGLKTITPMSPLPAIKDVTQVDGTTQGGYAGSPLIQLSGNLAGAGADGLVFASTASGSELKGLIVNRFGGGSGVRLDASKSLVDNCWIGTDATGAGAAANFNGISISGSRNTIGGLGSAGRNVISGNTQDGIAISGANAVENQVIGNYIGTDASGTLAVGNFDGVAISSASNVVGVPVSGGGNVISGNRDEGVFILGTAAAGNLMQANLIGTTLTGMTALPNGDQGVFVRGGAFKNLVGGESGEARNVISGNAGGGILFSDNGTTDNAVQGNLIGLRGDGAAALPNGNYGVGLRDGAAQNVIGGLNRGDRNFISGNNGDGVQLFVRFGPAPTDNRVQGNYIGTDLSGAAAIPNTRDGVHVEIGNGTQCQNNLISGNRAIGVFLARADGSVVSGNFIGTIASGLAALPNGSHGVEDVSNNVTIGGGTAAERNLISGNGGHGVYIAAASNSQIKGNFIGIDRTGKAAIPNAQDGVNLKNGMSLVIGGTTAGERNVISGNTGSGVNVNGTGSTGNQILGNFIGTDVIGAAALGNHVDGVILDAAHDNKIGGTVDGAGNLISANGNDGVTITGATANNNLVQGNLIGTDLTTKLVLGNPQSGVLTSLGATGNLVGGAVAGAGNVIGGSYIGVQFASPGNTAQGNFIGTNRDGSAAIPNVAGVTVLSDNNLIGGAPSPLTRNVISGNTGEGVFFGGGSGEVSNNFIGVRPDGFTAMGNGRAGVELTGASHNVRVGATSAAYGNIIAFNGRAGVDVASGVGHTILGNSIHDNVGLGIDLANDGVTPNDPLDADAGPNARQNFPTIASVSSMPAATTVKGALSSAPSTNYQIDVYASPSADPSGYGEGQRYLGAFNVATDAAGNVNFAHVFAGGVPAGWFITATATQVATGNTSEFSPVFTVPDIVPPRITSAGFPYLNGPVHRLNFTFSENVLYSLTYDDFTITNVDTGATVPLSLLGYDPLTNTAVPFLGGILPDGNYRATVHAAGLNDVAGNLLDGNGDGTGGDDYTYNFFFLNGDVNRDRKVDFNDLVVLAQHYNTTDPAWDHGDLNYDGTIDFNDLVTLAQRYNTSLPAPAAPSAVPALAAIKPASSVKTAFSTRSILDMTDEPVIATKPALRRAK
ncbi:MAG TPA: hypothetical protein VH475_28540 [Tepidisphaeraceae bacterium]